MTDLKDQIPQRAVQTQVSAPAPNIRDRGSLTYANAFPGFWARTVIKTIEWLSGKIRALRRIQRFQAMGAPSGRDFWPAATQVMGIHLTTPGDQLDRIPKEGPVIVVANHPHGLIDGIVLADLIGRRREDYRILARALMTGLDPSSAQYMISVPFPHEPDALRKMVDMRTQAMAHLKQNGVIALFPAGGVAASDSWHGPAIEGAWSPFTAKMIRSSGATIVPMYFPGSNSRIFQIANQISPVLRQGLLIHEVVRCFDQPQAPIIGHPIPPKDWAEPIETPRRFMAWLRQRTLALKNNPDERPVFRR